VIICSLSTCIYIVVEHVTMELQFLSIFNATLLHPYHSTNLTLSSNKVSSSYFHTMTNDSLMEIGNLFW